MRKLALILLPLLIMIPSVNAGDVFAEDVYQIGCFNASIIDMGYDSKEKHLFFEVIPNEDSNSSYGMGLFIMKFNVSRAPDLKEVRGASINNESVKNMVKNYTFVESTHEGIPCMFLEVYFYLFENHSVTNEQPIEHNIQPSRFQPASDNDGVRLYVGEETLINSTSESSSLPESQIPDFTNLLLPIGIGSGLIGSLIILKKRFKMQSNS